MQEIKRFTNKELLGEVIVTINSLNPKIYLELHKSVDFSDFEEGDVKIALDNDLVDVVVYKQNEAIAMGRLVGDRRLVFLFKDIIVLPEYQGVGIGRLVIEQLMSYIDEHACIGAQLALMCTVGNEEFYRKFGFFLREKNENGSGMVKIYGK